MLILRPETESFHHHPFEVFSKSDAGVEIRTENREKKKALKFHPREKTRGEVVGKLISADAYTHEDTLIKNLVEELNESPEISAVGVVNGSGAPLGILVRKKLFDLIGKRFGRELIENKTIAELIEKQFADLLIKGPVFHHDTSIFSVAEVVQSDLQNRDIVRFTAVDMKGQFAGIFTNIDLLFYLSSMTQADLKIAQKLQSSIVKDREMIHDQRFTLAAGAQMAKGVGGDFYLVKKIDEESWVLSLCDVSGKGVSAALITTLLGGLFSIYNFRHGLSHFIRKLNQYIIHSFQMEKYLTGLFMRFEPATGKTLIYDMGHAYLYVFRNQRLHQIKSSEQNFPVGIMENLSPAACSFQLKPGDILLAFTDGIPEQCDDQKEEYGVGRMEKIFKECGYSGFETIPDRLLSDLKAFRGKEPQHDDITFFALKYQG